jgi:hypothetical protein
MSVFANLARVACTRSTRRRVASSSQPVVSSSTSASWEMALSTPRSSARFATSRSSQLQLDALHWFFDTEGEILGARRLERARPGARAARPLEGDGVLVCHDGKMRVSRFHRQTNTSESSEQVPEQHSPASAQPDNAPLHGAHAVVLSAHD